MEAGNNNPTGTVVTTVDSNVPKHVAELNLTQSRRGTRAAEGASLTARCPLLKPGAGTAPCAGALGRQQQRDVKRVGARVLLGLGGSGGDRVCTSELALREYAS